MSRSRRKKDHTKALLALAVVVVIVLVAGLFLIVRMMENQELTVGEYSGGMSKRARGRYTNLLLVCTDEKDEGSLRGFYGSDGILLVTVNKTTEEILFTAFRGNTLVKADDGGEATLAEIYRDGGVQKLKKALSGNFGVLPDYYAVFDESTVQDAFGGKTGSIRDLGVSELAKLAKSITKQAKTDIPAKTLLSLAAAAKDYKDYKKVSQSIPIEDSYQTEGTGKSEILIPDLEANAAYLQASLYEAKH